jgi:hypothetical protein
MRAGWQAGGLGLVPRGVLVAVAVGVALAFGALKAPAPAEAARGCGLITSDGAPVHVKAIRRASCRTARRVLGAYLNSHAPCSGSACTRRHFGWTCQAAPAYAFPRLASCRRGRGRLAAYSAAD